MTNKLIIEQTANNHGYTIGCYDEKLELLKTAQLRKLLEYVEMGDYTDVDVAINRRKHVVELAFVDGDVDFSVLTKAEYIDRYGDERWAED